MVLKKGSKGPEVKELQKFLGVTADGIFGAHTEALVMAYQEKEGLMPDGIVGPNTWGKMGLATTDLSESSKTEPTSQMPYKKKLIELASGLSYEEFFMPVDEYKKGPIKAEWIFLHHTAGWHNPYNTITAWDADTRGAIATEWVLGGPSSKDGSKEHDGKLLQAFPKGNWGYHLGKNGSEHMHKNSVGIEVCNFGYVVDGKTYAGTKVDESQIVKLAQPFRGHSYWHRYSDKQIEVLKLWLQYIGERDGIDITKGLPALVKQKGAAAFEFNDDAYYGRVKGVWTHTNTRKDKVDMFPQQELMDMLVSL